MSITMDIHEVLEHLPHRYPFLLVDRVTEFEANKRVLAYKNVSCNEPFFQGHFPGHPIMPGVLIVEAMAQSACAMVFSQGDMKNKLAFFMGIEEVKFRKPVIPGMMLELEVEMLRIGSRAGKVRGVARVNGELATESVFSFAIGDKNA